MELIRLFVDVDDTLVHYKSELPQNPYGLHVGTPWEPNERLIAGIRAFREQYPDALIVVWSGGGREYARVWADKLLPDLDVMTLGKNTDTFNLIRVGDIVVDDFIPFKCATTVFGPNEWPIVENTG